MHRLERLSEHLGGKVEIWAKREDCNSGLAYGGNKVRKLEYLAADALAQGCDTLVSIGGVQSNHTRQVAAVAARLGLECVLVQEHWVEWPDAVYEKVGNILLSRIMGADVRLDPAGFDIGFRDELGAGARVGRGAAAASRTRFRLARRTIRSAAWASRAGRDEVQAQERELGVFFDTIVVCSVTGSTQAGMIAGFADGARGRARAGDRRLGDGRSRPGIRSPVSRGAPPRRSASAASFVDDEIVLLDEWHAGTYGIPDDKTIDAIRLCARLEGMLTDPVYEGKSMAALIDLVALRPNRARLARPLRPPRRPARTQRVLARVRGLIRSRRELRSGAQALDRLPLVPRPDHEQRDAADVLRVLDELRHGELRHLLVVMDQRDVQRVALVFVAKGPVGPARPRRVSRLRCELPYGLATRLMVRSPLLSSRVLPARPGERVRLADRARGPSPHRHR